MAFHKTVFLDKEFPFVNLLANQDGALFCFSFVSVSPLFLSCLWLLVWPLFHWVLVINPESHLWKDFYFLIFLLTPMNRIPKEDLELQCLEAETTPTLKMEKRQLSFLMCSRVGPLMGCFSECLYFPALLAGSGEGAFGGGAAVCALPPPKKTKKPLLHKLKHFWGAWSNWVMDIKEGTSCN